MVCCWGVDWDSDSGLEGSRAAVNDYVANQCIGQIFFFDGSSNL